MFEIDMLPAEHGDALWVSWGDSARPRHLLIDAGPDDADVRSAVRRRLDQLAERGGALELLVVTHIDADHIGGVLRMLKDGVGVPVGDVWFNGYRHLFPEDTLGAVQAEEVSALLEEQQMPWNKAFAGEAVSTGPDDGPALPQVELDDGLRLTVLGPTPERLRQLRPVWEEECRKAGIVPGVARDDEEASAAPADVLGATPDPEVLAAARFRPDPSKANGASIVVLAEHEGRTALLTGDAFGADIVSGLARRAADQRGRRIDAVKLPHHGSRGNVSRELVEACDSPVHLFSSSGQQFGHPHQEAVARVLVGASQPTELRFNYRTEFNDVWDSRSLKASYGFDTVYAEGADGLVTSL